MRVIKRVLCITYKFLVEVQTNAGYIHATSCVIANWRLGLRASLVAREKRLKYLEDMLIRAKI